MNNYYLHPVENSKSFINNSVPLKTEKEKNCFPIQEYKESCEPDVMYGYHKPLNEVCATINGTMNKGPEGHCASLWNNMTRRKSLVKDY